MEKIMKIANEEKSVKKIPSMAVSLLSLALIIATLIVGILVAGLDEHLLLVCCIGIMGLTRVYLGYNWDDIFKGMGDGIMKALPVLLFFFVIGMAIAAWIYCGTLPTLIYYGLNVLSPAWILPAALIITSLISLCTGSSWTTVGTVGVVLLGIGTTMGIHPLLIAGCIISGAYFGDKMSPLSDTTNLAPAIAGAEVFEHIKAMLYTTIPVFVIVLVVYSALGMKYSGTELDVAGIFGIQNAITATFHVSLIMLLPLAVVLVLGLLKFPAIPSLMIVVALSFPLAAIYQDASLAGFFDVLNCGNAFETGVESVDTLVNRGGIQGLMWTLSLGVFALALGGLISLSGILNVLIGTAIEKLPNRKYLPACTILTGISGCVCLGEQYMGIVLIGELYKDVYPKAGLQRRMLSRCIEESSTVTSALMPWTTGGAFMFGALGISPLAYGPYTILNWVTPLLGAILPIIGYSLLVEGDKKKVAAEATRVSTDLNAAV
jgi:NhaC family Na+:H+ antiporter